MNAVIVFEPSGNATCLHTDKIPLAELGRLDVRRASSIEWNESEQHWEVRVHEPLGNVWPVMFTDQSRARCVEWEHEYFNERLARE